MRQAYFYVMGVFSVFVIWALTLFAWHDFSAANVLAHVSGQALIIAPIDESNFSSPGEDGLAEFSFCVFNPSFSTVCVVGAEET